LNRKFWHWIAGVLAALLVQQTGHARQDCDVSQPAWEEPVRMSEFEPGSLLVFPLYDARPGESITIHTVTNLNFNRVRAGNDFRTGDVLLHCFYVGAGECLLFNRFEFLTPGDTLSVVASDHNPEEDFGYLVVRAADPETGLMVDFDYLVGDQIVVDARDNFVWTVPAMAFRSLTDERFSTDPEDPIRSGAGHAFVDLVENDGDGDGNADFDGNEFAYFPDRLIISSFFEENRNVGTDLILLTPLDPLARVTLNFWFFNNIETRFSRSFQFSCYWSGSLGEISAIVRSLEGDPNELPLPGLESGWAVLDGRRATLGDNIISEDPPVLGFMIQLFRTGQGHLGTARPLHHQGYQCGDDF